MRRLVLISLISLLAGWTGAQAAEKPVLSFTAEFFLHKHFGSLAGHKALAASETGGWGYADNAPNRLVAESLATLRCYGANKQRLKKDETQKPCEVIAADDETLKSDLVAAMRWQLPAEGQDRPFAKGFRQTLPKGAAKGTILHVHGCDGLGERDVMRVWADYFNVLGYDFYAPLSFADKRPKASCGKVSDYPMRQTSTNWRLRVAQTLRTIATLRKQQPGQPIFLWGHSEGGMIVQAVQADVAGVIVTGEECGVESMPVATPAGVPYLYVLGQNDPYIDGLGSPVTWGAEGLCRQRAGPRPVGFHVAEGVKHTPFPWQFPASIVIPRFLGSGPVLVEKVPISDRLKRAWKKQRSSRKYAKAKPGKVAAGDAKGQLYFIAGSDDLAESREYILHYCARAVSRKTNVFKTRKHICSLVDVDGNPP